MAPGKCTIFKTHHLFIIPALLLIKSSLYLAFPLYRITTHNKTHRMFLEYAKHCLHIQDGKTKSPRSSAMPGMTQWKKPALSVDGLQCFLVIYYRSPGFLKVLRTDRHEFYYIQSPGQGHNMIKVLTYIRL